MQPIISLIFALRAIAAISRASIIPDFIILILIISAQPERTIFIASALVKTDSSAAMGIEV